MISRTSLGRNAQAALRCQCHIKPSNRRSFAAAASGTFSYETGDAFGIKFGSRDLPGPTTHLAVVAKAGTRYQLYPGFADALEQFAFKSTHKRSALRITREAELLGSELLAYHSRENLVIGAKFLREDLPYFTELLGEVISKTKYTSHELDEDVLRVIKLSQKAFLANTAALAINSAHAVAFHRGLGVPLHPTSSIPIAKYLNQVNLDAFSRLAYCRSNIAVVANGASHTDLSKWMNEFFSETSVGLPELPELPELPQLYSPPTQYYGGEERISHDSGNNMVIAFPGSSSFTGGAFKPEILVLAALLGGESTIKWSSGFSLLSKITASPPYPHITTTHSAYSDAGLLSISISGTAKDIKIASQEVVKTLNTIALGNVNQEDVKKAVATAKFEALNAGQNVAAGLELTGAGLIQGGKAFQIDDVGKSISGVTEDQVKKAAKSLFEGKATVSTVGELHVLPFAEELGLNV